MRHLDLFSGIGGFALAARLAGFDTVAFCEIDPFCKKVLRKNFGAEVIIHDDIKQLDGSKYFGIELITGGFPCQPYSDAGKKRGDSDPRALWGEMRRVVREAKPAWVVGENVSNFANMGLDAACADLENEGYEVQPFIIPAVCSGAAHRRKRVFIVANSKSVRHIIARKNVENDKSKIEKSGLDSFGNHNANYWAENKPPICGISDGIPNRVDRLRGLGNAVVPQQVYPILDLIARIQTDATL